MFIKTLDRYILLQLIAVTLLGVVSLSALLLLGQLFKELRSLLVDSHAPMSIMWDFVVQVIPFSLTFSIPWGFLTAVLLVYGRLAADNELTSMRMAGLNLWRLSAPAIFLSIVLSFLCYWINTEVAPKSKQTMSDIVLDAAMSDPKKLLRAGQSITKFNDFQLFIDARPNDDDTLLGLHVYPSSDKQKTNGADFDTLHAEKARIVSFDPAARVLQLDLENTTIEQRDGDSTYTPLLAKMPMTFKMPERRERKMKANRFTNSEIADLLADPGEFGKLNHKDQLSFETEPTKRASFSIACIVFSLIGVPLAITARRRDTSTGFAMGILVAAIYFVALVFSELSRKMTGIAPYIILWLPNIACFLLAIHLHRRAQFRG